MRRFDTEHTILNEFVSFGKIVISLSLDASRPKDWCGPQIESACKWEGDMAVPNSMKMSRVFVVDDEFVIATTLATILERSGFEAISFTDPLKALKAAQVNPPDLLISDVMMPELSGIDLAIGLRRLYPYCKVLLFSGHAATSNLLDIARARGYDFEMLSKPIHPAEFLKKIRDVTTERAPTSVAL